MVAVCVLLWFVKLLFLFCTKCISDEECVVHSFLPSYTATKMDDQSFDLTHLHKRGNQKENKIQSKERERGTDQIQEKQRKTCYHHAP